MSKPSLPRHLTHVYPRFKTLSGGETAMLQLVNELTRLGVRSTILTRGYSERCDPLRDPAVEILTPGQPWMVQTGHHLVDSFLDVWFSPAVLSRLDETDGLIFHAESTAPAVWYAKRVLKLSKPCIYFCYQPPRFAYDLTSTTSDHGTFGYLAPLYARVHRAFDRRWVRAADAVWTFSKIYGEWCRQLYELEQVRAIAPGIDFERFSSGEPTFIRRKWNIDSNILTLATVNKLIPRKNVEVFLAVLAWLRNRGRSVRGFVVGDGPCRAKLESAARECDLTDVIIFTGHIPLDELPHYYAGSDVYLFLERNVPFGMTPLEAAAAGTPVIAPRGGGAMETVIDGITGYLVEEQLSAEEIGAKVLAIVDTPGLRAKMGNRAREHARPFTWRRYATEVCEAFGDVVNRNIPRPAHVRV
jgi:glycosyltransferase involved in cell wall biosynthesis